MVSPARVYGFAIVAGISLVVLSGCNGDKPKPEAENHEEHGAEDMPESFSAAVAELKEHAPEIKDAFEAGDPHDADAAVHHVGDILKAMPELIDSSDLTDEQKAQAKEAREALFDQYTKLDDMIHGLDTETKYEDVEGKIDEALAKLIALRPTDSEHEDHADEETP